MTNATKKKSKTAGSESRLAAIRSAYEGLPPSERRVADFVLADAGVVHLSITDVVERSGAGYGTVMRFCRRLGCAGFQDFKIRLAAEFAMREPRLESEAGDFLAASARSAREDILATEQTLSRRDLDLTAAALAKSGRVLIAGVGGSAPMAMELAYRLTRLGIEAVAIADAHMARVRASLLGKADVAVLVSFSGATRDMLQAAQIARRSGARVACLTNHGKSPLSGRAHFTLATAIAAGPMAAEIAPRAAVAVVVDALCRSIATKRTTSASALKATARADAEAQL